MKTVDLVIVGGGPAGMTAAVEAHKNGLTDILILERDSSLGGILQQCIHNGFGLHKFNEELTGPEYAWKYEEQIHNLEIPYMLNTMVLEINSDKEIIAINSEYGIFKIKANAIILSMGCRERPKGALNIAGSRPSGIFTAGTAQKFVNIKGYMPGKKVVILGSGDIGLIMARRMTLEGAEVKAVCELMPYSGGLERNIEQCLRDFNIPLKLSCTVAQIHGKERLEGVTIANVDKNRRIIPETKEFIACDTLLLSVGLIPENELTKSAKIDISPVTNGAVVDQNRQTSIPGIFACGNVLHVHDLVDNVSDEAEIAGKSAVSFINGDKKNNIELHVIPDGKVRYTVPQKITDLDNIKIFFRVANIYENVNLVVRDKEKTLISKHKEKLTPGEMEALVIPKKFISDVSGNELYIGLEELA